MGRTILSLGPVEAVLAFPALTIVGPGPGRDADAFRPELLLPAVLVRDGSDDGPAGAHSRTPMAAACASIAANSASMRCVLSIISVVVRALIRRTCSIGRAACLASRIAHSR